MNLGYLLIGLGLVYPVYRAYQYSNNEFTDKAENVWLLFIVGFVSCANFLFVGVIL